MGSNGFGRVPGYSQIWVMPCASMVYTWSSDREYDGFAVALELHQVGLLKLA